MLEGWLLRYSFEHNGNWGKYRVGQKFLGGPKTPRSIFPTHVVLSIRRKRRKKKKTEESTGNVSNKSIPDWFLKPSRKFWPTLYLETWPTSANVTKIKVERMISMEYLKLFVFIFFPLEWVGRTKKQKKNKEKRKTEKRRIHLSHRRLSFRESSLIRENRVLIRKHMYQKSECYVLSYMTGMNKTDRCLRNPLITVNKNNRGGTSGSVEKAKWSW